METIPPRTPPRKNRATVFRAAAKAEARKTVTALVCWICEKEITGDEPMLIVGGHTVHELCLEEVTN